MVSVLSRRGLALLAGVAVTTTGLAVPAAAQDADTPEQICTTATTGTTNWNVKESFNNYLEGPIANGGMYKYKGGIETSGGIITEGTRASRSLDWPVASADIEAGTVTHSGTVHYTGHNAYTGDDATQAPDNFVLDNSFSNLTVELTDEITGRILVDYRSREFVDTTTVADFKSGTQAELATITFDTPVDLTADGAVTATGTTVLTTSGVDVFGGFYDEGAELSNLTLNLNNTTTCVDAPEGPGDDTNDDTTDGTDTDSSTGSSDGGPLGIVALLAALGGIGAAIVGWLNSTGALRF